jgi:plasmid segregation protein ParM
MIVGVDIGYGYTKAISETRQVVFPSIIGRAERIRYEEDVECQQHLPNRSGLSILTEEGNHFVGELALLQSRVQWTLLDRSRVEDPSARLLFLASLCELTRNSPKKASEFRIVTGLPVKWYDDKDKVVRQFQGKHMVRLTRDHRSVQHLSVTDVLVVPQPFGSLFDAILDDRGKIVAEALASSRIGVIDIGTYTTDYVLVDRLRYIERGSGSISTGMAKAYQLIGRSLLDTFGLDVGIHEVDRLVRRGMVTVFGEDRNIGWLSAPVLNAIGQEILAYSGTLWGAGRDLQTILVTGGGGTMLFDLIAHRYRHAQILSDAVLANVRGFEKYGLRRWGSQITQGVTA